MSDNLSLLVVVFSASPGVSCFRIVGGIKINNIRRLSRKSALRYYEQQYLSFYCDTATLYNVFHRVQALSDRKSFQVLLWHAFPQVPSASVIAPPSSTSPPLHSRHHIRHLTTHESLRQGTLRYLLNNALQTSISLNEHPDEVPLQTNGHEGKTGGGGGGTGHSSLSCRSIYH